MTKMVNPDAISRILANSSPESSSVLRELVVQVLDLKPTCNRYICVLTTLYELCSVKLNKERAVSAGAVRPLVGLVGEQGRGLAEKAMVVLNSLAGVEIGRDAIVEDGGIAALVEAIEDGSDKGKEFAVLTLLQMCGDSVRNRGLMVREGGIPPLAAMSQTGTAKAKHKFGAS